jgi:hypothetical protein
MSRDRFYARLKETFLPRLRSAGFIGSGQNFRRVQGESIHAVNLQGDKYGGRCAVNLGIHFTFMPLCWCGELPDGKKIREVDCEFRKRLSPDSKPDHWWTYGDASLTSEQSADSLERVFLETGEAYFQNHGSVSAVLAALSSIDFGEKWTVPFLGGKTRARAALAAARIYAHLGNHSECGRFARLGLSHLEGGVALRPELECLAHEE